MKKALSLLLLLPLIFTLNSGAVLAQADIACQANVIVQRDDWLSKLADKFFGDPLVYQAIADATNAKAAIDETYATIDDVDFIEIGWKLCIPVSANFQVGTADDAAAAPAEVITLTVWDMWVRPAESQVIETLHREFEAANPDVTVERTVQSFDDMKATVQLALGRQDGPDVVQINQGRLDMVALVAAGLLTDLTPYWQRYSWSNRQAVPLAARNRVVSDGSGYGQGRLYGMAPTAEFVGVFYNKEKFAAAGLELPRTFTEFEAALEKLKAAGETPIMYGNLDGWPAIHTYGQILNTFIDNPTYLDNFIYGRGDVSFDIPASVEAAARYKEWGDKGYFTPDFNGVAYDDALQRFANDQGAMFISGTWASEALLAAPTANKFGFFLLPPQTETANNLVIAGTSAAYAIRQDSPNTELAAEYIDWMMSDRAMELWQQAGLLPVVPIDPTTVEPGLYAELIAAWDQVAQSRSIGHYLDWATPTFYDTLIVSLQELGDGLLTPREFTQKLQTDYEAFGHEQ